VKYFSFVQKSGYPNAFYRKDIRDTHFVEFYSYEDTFIKASCKNEATKGFKSEFDILNKLSHLDFIPQVKDYKKLDGIELLFLSYIEGEELTKHNYCEKFEKDLLNKLFDVYSAGVVHGDIKKDNILVNRTNLFLIDFDQAYTHKDNIDFSLSPDIIGNKGLNYTNLIKGMTHEKHK